MPAKGTRVPSGGKKTPRKRTVAGGRAGATAAATALAPARSGKAKSAQEIVAEQMPGWKIASEPMKRSPSRVQEVDMKIETGPSIVQLRRKFLGNDSDVADVDESAAYAPLSRRVKTVRIEPKSGGPAKTADIRGGKISIVQG